MQAFWNRVTLVVQARLVSLLVKLYGWFKRQG